MRVPTTLAAAIHRSWLRLLARRARSGAVVEGVTERRLRIAREWLVRRAGDPIVKVAVGGTTLVLPLSHQLPAYRAVHPHYDAFLPAFVGALAERLVRAPVLVDVGANVGDTMALVAARVPRLRALCVEGTETFLPCLHRNAATAVHAGASVVLAHSFVGDGAGRYGAPTELGGTARLSRDASAPILGTLDDLVLLHAGFDSPDLLKTDTDGLELAVLRGARALLARAHPFVFVEWHPVLLRGNGEEPAALFSLLQGVGYAHALCLDNHGNVLGQLDLAGGGAAEQALALVAGNVSYLDLLAWPAARDSEARALLAAMH